MASELQIDYTTGRNVYFLVRSSSGTIWSAGLPFNGSNYVIYVTAEYAAYQILAAEQGLASGYYTGNMPFNSPAGVYYVLAKERAGSSPAETDATIGRWSIDWDGSAPLPLSTVLSVSTISANLLDLADGVEANKTVRQALRLMLAAMCGKLSGADSQQIVVRDTNDSKNRIAAAVDGRGNRTAVALDAS